MFKHIENWRLRAKDLEGWRRAVGAFFLGAISVLALPPVYFVPGLIPAFAGLIWLLAGSEKTTAGRWWQSALSWIFNGAFAAGWWFGLGFFVAGLYWISFSFLVDAKTFAWMIPFAVTGLSAMFAVYVGLATAICFRVTNSSVRRILYFSILWIAAEWVRGWAFTGFPWNLLGTVWTFSDAMIQFSAFLGIMGLSLVTVLAATSFAILGEPEKSHRFRMTMMLVPLVLLGAIWIGGTIRLAGAENAVVENVWLRLVQPNIAQRDKWKPALRGKHLNNLLELSEAPPMNGDGRHPTHIIWPETATPFFLEGNEAALRILSQVVPREGALLTGSPRRTKVKGKGVQLWNSLHVVTPDAKISSTFDKFHLVPFGEYVPLRDSVGKFLNIAKLTAGRTDFSSGGGNQTIEVVAAPAVSPLICYEVIFSGAAWSKEQARPGWLLNITNDSWFGTSSGPYQHLATAKFRAVEEGLPMVRVANTGISAVIDAFGRTNISSRLNERIYLDSALPEALPNPTLFSRIGLWGLLASVLGIILISRLRNLD